MDKIKIECNGQMYQPTRFPLRIGRVWGNDIVVCAPGVADDHARIEKTPEGLVLHAVAEAHLDGKKIRGKSLLKHNGLLTIGAATLRLWSDSEQVMPKSQCARAWGVLAHPVAALVWFVSALFLSLWENYLNTEKYYIFNWHLLFTLTLTLLALVWLLHGIVSPIARRHLVFPLLGVVSLVSLVSHLLDQAAYWYAFQFGTGGFGWLMLFASAGACIWLLRVFLRAFVPLYGKMLNRYALLLALPVLLLLSYRFLQSRDFFAYRAGSYPSYHHGLLREMAPWRKAMPLERFFNLEKESKTR